jgi:hypothetical protein
MRLPQMAVAHPTNEDERPRGPAPSMTQTERRGTPRIQLSKPAYINFEPYNTGGVITDICGAGLRFHTVAPVQQGGLVRFSIFLGAAQQLEAVGELIWMDSARKIGGLRFTVLPPGAAEQIRNWAEASESSDASKSSAAQPMPPLRAPGNALNNEASLPDRLPFANPTVEAARISQDIPQDKNKASFPPDARPAPAQVPASGPGTRSAWVPPSMRAAATGAPDPATASVSVSPGALHPQPWTVPGAYQQPSAMPWITHFEPDPPARAPFFRGLLGGIVICLMLAPVGWFAFQHYVRQDSLVPSANPVQANQPLSPASSAPLADVSNSLNSGSSSQQPQAVPSQEVPLSANPNIPVPAEENTPHANSEAAAPPQSTQSQLAAPQIAPPEALSARGNSLAPASQSVAKAPATLSPQPADAGASQLMLARQYLDGNGHARDTTVASRLLWTAVEKGNATAEATLADLYLRGDGVAKNCDQARVLLAAASGKGNIEAMQKLQQLNQTGCR